MQMNAALATTVSSYTKIIRVLKHAPVDWWKDEHTIATEKKRREEDAQRLKYPFGVADENDETSTSD